MEITVEKIPGGFRLDGLELKGGKCGCTSILPCCHSWSKLKKTGNSGFVMTVKTSTPETVDLFSWGYVVAKGGMTIEVKVDDARDKTIFSGWYPPRVEEWIERGWKVVSKDGEREDFGVWRCAACKHLYRNSREAVQFEDLPDDWRCPVCRVLKADFEHLG